MAGRGAPIAKSSRVRWIKSFINAAYWLLKRCLKRSSSVMLASGQRIERDIDAIFIQVARDILPEICKLQGGAGGVGKRLALLVAISAEIEHQAAHRIRGIAAVIEHALPVCVAMNGLILPKRDQQIGKRLHGNMKFANGFRQRHKNRVRGRASVGAAKLVFPGVEQFDGARRIGNFIA